MLKSKYHRALDIFGRALYPVAITSTVAVLFVLYTSLRTEFAVFGMYGLLGLLGGALVYYGTDDTEAVLRLPGDERFYRTGVYVACATTVGIVVLTGEPLFVAFGLVSGYALVTWQLFADPLPERILPQLAALFLLSPLSKYLTAGTYFGDGDILIHTRFVDEILAAGSLNGIADTSYYDYPGLQLLASTAGDLSGLGGYDGIMLTGLAAYAIVLPAVYLVITRFTGDPLLGMYTAFAVAVLDDIVFYVSYLFPQSLASVLIIALAVLATLVTQDELKWRVVGLFVLVSVTLVFTHHLTQVLFVPLVAVIIGVYALHGRGYARTVFWSRPFGLFVLTASMTALQLFRTNFIDRLLVSGREIIEGGAQGGYDRGVDLVFGSQAEGSAVAMAVEWLVSPYGLYLILLLVVFSIGVTVFLRTRENAAPYSALCYAGIIGSLLIFETPLSIKSLNRIRAPWLFVFAVILAIGFLQFRDRIGPSRQGRLLLVIVVLVAAAGPLVTADNFYGLDPRPTTQSAFSDQEVAELEAVAEYTRGQEETTTTFWTTRLAMRRYGVEGLQRSQLDGERLVLPAGKFIYRAEETNHAVHFLAGEEDQLYSNTVVMDDPWLDQRIASSNKVYSAGGTGVIWGSSERSFEGV